MRGIAGGQGERERGGGGEKERKETDKTEESVKKKWRVGWQLGRIKRARGVASKAEWLVVHRET